MATTKVPPFDPSTGLTPTSNLFPKVNTDGKLPSGYWQGYQGPQDYWNAKYSNAVNNYLGIEDKIYGNNKVASSNGIADVKKYKQLSSQLLDAQKNLLSVYQQGANNGFSEGQGLTLNAPVINGDYIQKIIQHSGELAASMMDKHKVNSPEYKAAQDLYTQTGPNFKTAQTVNATATSEQKAIADAKAITDKANAAKAELPKLQEELQRAKDQGKDTSAIEQKIKEAQNASTAIAPTNATHTPDVQPTTTNGPLKPIVTPPTTPTPPTTTGGGTGGSSTGGTYNTVKGVLNYQDNPFTGEYQGKYYSNGKLETPAQIKADFMAKYGEQAKFIASVPELGNLLTTAIAQNWAPTQWATQFANTQWAQAHPGDIGLAEIKRISAPEQYNTEYNAAQSRIASLAESLGIKLTPQQLGSQVDIKTPPALDQNAVASGQDMTNWLMQHPSASDAQITQQMAKYGTIDPTTGPGGTLKQFSNSLQNLAQQYGVLGQVSTDGTSKVFDNLAATEAAAGGNISDPATLVKYENQYKTQAMATYKPYADQIANGAKVSDLASPYLSTYASLMEVSPSDIQLGALTGPGAMVSKALTGDANGQVVNPYDFASQVRSQPAWLNTQNAHATVNSAADYMISKMGMG